MASPPADDDAGENVSSADTKLRIRKAPNAFRTISEVADDLHIPQHVLRFWETKFPQVKPLKRGGGRRYYRPDDIALLRRISGLLYVKGYTIRGVQRLLREGGGQLSDNIPPPDPNEKAETDHLDHGDDTELQPLNPDAEVSSNAQPHLLRPREPARPRAARQDAEASEAEIKRLRALLIETLHELEILRSLLV